MASIYFTGVSELEKALQALGDRADDALDDLIAEMIDIGTEAWKEQAKAEGFEPPGKSGHGTGDMISSIGPGPIRSFRDGRAAEVYPQGVNSKGVRNAEVAFYQHYGTSRIKPTYWVDKAEAAADRAVPERTDAVWQSYLDEVSKDNGGT